MSALPQKRTLRDEGCPLCAISGLLHRNKELLFQHLVGNSEERRRHIQSERLGCFEVDDQLVFGGRLNREVGRLFALENAIDICGRTSELLARAEGLGT
jgi:hypothetical protein